MKLLTVVTQIPAIYNGCFTQNIFWEEKFTPAKMKICGSHNVRKHRDINNSGKYIILDIYFKLDCMDKREFTSSESNYYMGIIGKEMNTSMDFRTKKSNKKQKSRFDINDITNQDFRKLIRKFNNLPYIGYRSKQVQNKPIEAYLLLIKYITKIIKNERRI